MNKIKIKFVFCDFYERVIFNMTYSLSGNFYSVFRDLLKKTGSAENQSACFLT